LVVSRASARVIAGSTVGIRRASMVLPKPVDIGPRESDETAGVYYEEILTVRAPRAETREAWALRVAVPTCGCGCGGKIEVIPAHRTKGMPQYLHGHHPNSLRGGFDELRGRGYKLVGEVASKLGVSATTLRRMEAEGILPEARRVKATSGKLVRVYTAEELKLIVNSKPRERWLAKHPGRWA
jgi:hypothetical protein